jgi:HPt (histidine-containing phosphotransfer) domain-containing protein
MSTPEGRLYDLALIEEMAQGDKDFLKEVAETFVSSVPPVLDLLVNHCKNQEWKAVGDEAHNLKSNIDTFQITTIRDDIRRIELNGKQGIDLDVTPQIVDKVVDVLNKVIAQIKEEYGI